MKSPSVLLRRCAWLAAIAVMPTGTLMAADWTTPAERAKFHTTPSYAETRSYLQRLAEAAPDRIRLTRFGVSPQGRELMLVVAAKNGEFTPAAAHASGKPILLVQAGIHAGEIEGNDAGLMLLRDLSVGAKHAALLDRAILVYLPIFNVDGHENASPYHRINQRGPREMGFRSTAQRLNLNRDYTKADAPEMRDWLAMFDAWMPDLFMDIHTTDGADYAYDLTWYREEWGPLHPAVKRWQADAFDKAILPAFEKHGHLAAPYLELVDHRDITKGIANFGSGPRFSTGYVALRNRAAVLVETHMLKPYAVRVRATYDLIVATLAHLNRDGEGLRKAVAAADADTIARAADAQATLPIVFRTSTQSVPFTLKGYAFTQEASAISGDTWVRYHPRRPKTYVIPDFHDLVATESVHPPAAYLTRPSGRRSPTSCACTACAWTRSSIRSACAWNAIASLRRAGASSRSKAATCCASSRRTPKPPRPRSPPAPIWYRSISAPRTSPSPCSNHAPPIRCCAGVSSMRCSSRRKAPMRASPSSSRATCWPRTRRCGRRSTRSSPPIPHSPPRPRRGWRSSTSVRRGMPRNGSASIRWYAWIRRRWRRYAPRAELRGDSAASVRGLA